LGFRTSSNLEKIDFEKKTVSLSTVCNTSPWLLTHPATNFSLKAKKKAKAQVLGIAPLNMRSMCQWRFTIVEVVTDQHWL